MKRMEINDIHFGFITLHNGLGAYRMIDVEDLTKHKMESEQMIITEELCKNVNRAKDEAAIFVLLALPYSVRWRQQ